MQTPHNRSLEEIYDLAANYSDRQGLRIVPLAILVFLQSLPRPTTLERVAALARMLPLPLLVGLCGYVLIGRYYERRFGKVEQMPHGGMPVALQIVLMVVCVLVTIGIDVMVHPPIFVSGVLVAAWLIATSWSSRRIRGFYVATGAVLALISLLPLAGQSLQQVGSIYGMTFGLSLLIAGLNDHRQFVRHFGGSGAVDE
jgi:hypothetical protein